jgi:hypothetical protein
LRGLDRDALRFDAGDRQRRAALLATGSPAAEVVGDAEGGLTLWTGEVDHPATAAV